MLTSFVKEEKLKLLATIIVLSFFLYFWTNGPFNQLQSVVHLEHENTEFSTPKIVGENNQPPKYFETIAEAETEGFGNGLILDKNKDRESFGLITSSKDDWQQSNQYNKLLAHSKEFASKNSRQFKLNSAHHIPFVLIDDGKTIYLESKFLSHEIRGYAGPINCGIMLQQGGKINSVHHISSHETESYLRKIEKHGFYQQFQGKNLSKNHEIDAVSGATLTTEAIASTSSNLINEILSGPLENYIDLDNLNSFSIKASLSLWWILHIAVIFIMFLFGFQKKIKKSKKMIFILSTASLIYIGFFLNNSFTYISFIHPFVGTSVSSMVGIYALLSLLGAIWGKNIYCKYVCPFGNAQRLLLKVSFKKFRSKFFISNKWISHIRNGIAITLIIGILLGMRNWSNFELFPDLFGLEYKSIWFFIALGIVALNMIYPMIWCRLLCPTGSVLDAISELVEFRFKIKTLSKRNE